MDLRKRGAAPSLLCSILGIPLCNQLLFKWRNWKNTLTFCEKQIYLWTLCCRNTKPRVRFLSYIKLPHCASPQVQNIRTHYLKISSFLRHGVLFWKRSSNAWRHWLVLDTLPHFNNHYNLEVRWPTTIFTSRGPSKGNLAERTKLRLITGYTN